MLIQTKWLTKEEQDRFISYVQLEPNEFRRLRNIAIIGLMLYSGLRVHEVAALEISDIIAKEKMYKRLFEKVKEINLRL